MSRHDVIASVPGDEAARLAAIERYKLSGIGREPGFDRIARLTASLFDVPISLVSIVGSEMQCFRGACGLEVWGTPRDVAFCAFAILDSEVTVVPDTLDDSRFVKNPLVAGPPHVRFYAGAPLRLDGHAVGTLCIGDTRPRQLTTADRKHLADLARTVVDLIELRVERFAVEDHHQQLGGERELLKLTVENVSEGVGLFDADLRLMLWNEDFARLLGYPEGAVREGASATELVYPFAEKGYLGPGDPAAIVTAMMTSIQSSDSRHLDLVGADGKTIEFRRRTLGDGRFIATVRDVTTERQIARLKDELVSTVSHELRTPLTAIAGAIGLITAGAAGDLSPKASRLATLALRNAERLTGLVNDLLDVDKLQSGRMRFSFEREDIGKLLSETTEQNEPFAEHHGVGLALQIPNAPVVASIDRARFNQVISNLVSNACKFSPAGSTVQIRLEERGCQALIRVTDKGPGIGAEFRHRIFTRFSQEEGVHQAGHVGTGLGLAISKAIVEMHHGTIELDETYTDGAAFEILLPLASDAIDRLGGDAI
ncbi:GAF domain-containing sensor histidine kinase [Sphingopyxis sp. MSC1_008]|jgi:signal transduction histidine kinase|uniref:GAF domain-containing sensor histidine kinase n=1 Tax=Sphingopyxis sp. MSC1_008 TaxID=2909265 RepID=UPI0020C0DC3A|nr:ATP-binding protein [Sphingopyxis sp. MSC1_008]